MSRIGRGLTFSTWSVRGNFCAQLETFIPASDTFTAHSLTVIFFFGLLLIPKNVIKVFKSPSLGHSHHHILIYRGVAPGGSGGPTLRAK